MWFNKLRSRKKSKVSFQKVTYSICFSINHLNGFMNMKLAKYSMPQEYWRRLKVLAGVLNCGSGHLFDLIFVIYLFCNFSTFCKSVLTSILLICIKCLKCFVIVCAEKYKLNLVLYKCTKFQICLCY